MDLPPLSGTNVTTILADISATSRLLSATPPARPPKGVALWILLLLALMVVGGLFLPGGWNMISITAALMAILGVLGWAIVSNPLGVFINAQNIMSLSRFQMAVWTIVVLASYFSYALFRIHQTGFGPIPGDPKNDPLNIVIDPHLLILMGIGATSLVVAPAILSTKTDKTPAPMVTIKTALKSGDSLAEVDANRQGTLYGNSSVSDARATDMFQGDELGNTTHIDMAKVQMFFFTVISGVAYLIMIYRNLASATKDTDLSHLPVIPEGVVYALGISHAGYLTSKTIDHTPVEN
jgi:hypothetical protein